MSKLMKTTIITLFLFTTCVVFEYARDGFQPDFRSLYHMTIEYFEPDYSSLLYLGDLITYRINPNTIIASMDNGDKDIFELIPRQVNDDYESLYPPGTFAWKQDDYMQIADSLHQEVWKESLDGWQLIMAIYETEQCKEIKWGFDSALYYFYKTKGDEYVVHGLWITPQYGEVSANENILPNTGRWKQIEFNELEVDTAERALIISEQSVGFKARTASNNECIQIDVDFIPNAKYPFLSHPFDPYDWGWETCYYVDHYYCIVVGPYTGKSYKP